MEELISDLSRNSWIWLILAVITVLGLFLSIYLYLLSKKEKKIVFDFKRTKYLNLEDYDQMSEIEFYYKKKKIDKFFMYVYCITNFGKDSVIRNDVAGLDRIRVESKEETDILDYKILFYSEKSNNFSISKRENSCIIDFDYMDYGHGVVFQIISQSPLELSGKVIGQRKIERKDFILGDRSLLFTVFWSMIFPAILIFTAIFFVQSFVKDSDLSKLLIVLTAVSAGIFTSWVSYKPRILYENKKSSLIEFYKSAVGLT